MKDMKFTKQLRFAALSAVCVAVVASCTKDLVGPSDSDTSSTRLAISLPALSNGMTTRAGEPADFDAIHNLNIFIASGDQILHRLYIDNVEGAFTGTGADAGITGGEDASYKYVVTYPGTWIDANQGSGIHRRGMNNYIVVANYGSAITEATATDVAALRALQIGGAQGIVNPMQAVMFGESGTAVNMASDGTTGLKSVELERTAAIITLMIDGSGLNSDVEITPVSVSLHNVPVATYIGQDNIVTTAAGGVTPRDGAVAANGESYSATTVWGTSSITSTNAIRGGHYTVQDGEITSTAEGVVTPLYMYENYHGANFGAAGNTEQKTKRPAAATGTSQEAVEAASGACSYLQVTARYRDGSQYGQIAYRVFLGADALSDFNVMRNHYYQVTLTLSNTGIGEGGSSWRLDAQTSDIIMDVSDSDFIISGGGEMIVIPVDNSGSPAAFSVVYEGDGQDWVHMITTSGKSPNQTVTGWTTLGSYNQFPLTSGDEIFLYVEPMIRPTTWNIVGEHVRTVKFLMRTNNGKTETPYFTITQYEPVAIPLNAYLDNAEIVAKVESLGWSMGGTLYIDRADQENMLPWGFDGTTIAGDDITASGFTNGDNLMVNHGTTAGDYLPKGEPLSAMMHAAFMRYYQREGTPSDDMYPAGPLTIDAIRTFAPQNLPYNFAIPSVEEWELVNMINQASEIDFAGGLAILPFYDYWTSTAVAGSATQSYVFKMDWVPGDGGATPQDRTTPTRYRMIHYIP
jgi:hypothetical protein